MVVGARVACIACDESDKNSLGSKILDSILMVFGTDEGSLIIML